jgi:hypothetical protein
MVRFSKKGGGGFSRSQYNMRERPKRVNRAIERSLLLESRLQPAELEQRPKTG